MLKVASVVGVSFTLGELCGIHPEKRYPELIRRDLEAIPLIKSNNTNQQNNNSNNGDDSQLEYSFKNSIVHEIVYGSLLNSQRELLHSAVANYYEVAHKKDVEKYYRHLAHHWKEAHIKERAIYYMDKYGDQCLDKFDYTIAISVYSKLLHQYGNEVDTGRMMVATWHR